MFLRLRLPLALWLWLPPACLSASRRGGPVHSWLALLWCHSILCSVSRPSCALVRTFRGKVLSPFFFSLSLAIPQFGLLSHVSSLRLSSGHSGLVLTLSMQPVPPCPALAGWWWPQASGLFLHWQLQLGMYSVGFIFFYFYFFSLQVMFLSEIPKLLKDLPVRGFPGAWKVHLHDSLPRMGLCP